MPGQTKNISYGIMIDGKLSTDKHEIANAYNKYFIGIVAQIKESLGPVLTCAKGHSRASHYHIHKIE